jgi:hypothetical protein
MVSLPVRVVFPKRFGICVDLLNTDGISTIKDIIYIYILDYFKGILLLEPFYNGGGLFMRLTIVVKGVVLL